MTKQSFARVCALCVILAAQSKLKAEDGYRLWLRYGQANKSTVQQIIVQDDSDTGTIIQNELRAALAVGNEPIDRTHPLSMLIVGTPSNSQIVKSLGLEKELADLGDEGFIIRAADVNGQKQFVIASQSKMGLLYGSFEFIRLVQTQVPLSDVNISQKPKLQRRMLDHWDNPNGSIERGYAGKSIWQWTDLPGKVDPRYADYARANASIGINGAVLNNVNAKPEQLSTEYLKKTAAIADVLRPYGIRVYLSANFAAPKAIGGLKTADPLDPEVITWWKNKADKIYTLIPDFGGFLVKANSEGQPGPRDYKRTHADGANMMADALAPHNGVVIWRCFTYDGSFDKDRAKRAYKEFEPLDGTFHKNVFLQVKNGPIDFQPREMFHPLFGAMPKTALMAELEITQENTGHSTSLVNLALMWKEFLDAKTFEPEKDSTITSILENQPMNGIAGVANVGLDRNWSGYDFAQSNWYSFGRLAWDPSLTAAQVNDEWVRQTWGNDPVVVKTIMTMLNGSWQTMIDYEMPIGIHHIMEGGDHYAPNPKAFQDYHRAAADGIGYDRSKAGSDAVDEYAPEIAAEYGDLATCPDDVLLWFHHVSWDYKMKSGRTVWDELCYRYGRGVENVKTMQADWETLRGKIDDERFKAVDEKLAKQVKDSSVWRDTCIKFFQSKSGKPLPAYITEK